jgi:hypothetical protein
MRALAAAAALVVLLLAVAAASAAPLAPSHHAAALCGVERWSVKTLMDRPRLLPLKVTTIAYLTSRPAPASLPSYRLPFERHVFQVRAHIDLIRLEADQDFHVVLSDPQGRTMIAESPAPGCTSGATPSRRSQMASARRAVRSCPGLATVTGVAFFDFNHGQTGVAPNAIELHPILAFRCG